jgi:hypothetical protein
VEHLIAHIGERHSCPRGLLILADHHRFGSDRPWNIGPFTPDVFASDLPTTFEVVAEAKTPGDLMTPRSARQITAFLDHLSLRPQGFFYLGVPWYAVAQGQFVMRKLSRPDHAAVKVEVLACV